MSRGFVIQKLVKINEENGHHISMSNRTQFELNYLCDSALIIYVNLQLLFLTVYLNHF